MRLALISSILALGACAPAPQVSAPPSMAENQCRASEHQNLVGRHRSEIPSPPSGASWRVTCTTCPVTMDYNPNRLNILYDEHSGIVRDVRCG